MERGWFQSKRSSGLKALRVAVLVRRWRFRASRSRRSSETRSSKHWTGEACDLVRCVTMARRASAGARIPRVRRELITSSGLGIVGPEVVRDDVAVVDVGRKRDVEGDGCSTCAPALFAQRGEGTGIAQSTGELLAKVFEIDVLACPECGGRMQLIAFIAESTVAKRILDHLGLDSTG